MHACMRPLAESPERLEASMSAFRTPEASAPALDQGLVGRPDEGAPGSEAPHSSGTRPDSLTQEFAALKLTSIPAPKSPAPKPI